MATETTPPISIKNVTEEQWKGLLDAEKKAKAYEEMLDSMDNAGIPTGAIRPAVVQARKAVEIVRRAMEKAETT